MLIGFATLNYLGFLPFFRLAVNSHHTDNDDTGQHDLPFHTKSCHNHDAE